MHFGFGAAFHHSPSPPIDLQRFPATRGNPLQIEPVAEIGSSCIHPQIWNPCASSTQCELLDCPSGFLPIYDRDGANNQEFADQIKDSALVYMSGGDPHYLANSLLDTPVWKAVYENYLSGGSIAGCSAGAMVLSSHIPNFRLSKSEPTVGLNLIPKIRVIPHFDKFFKWIPESAAKILLNTPNDGILIGIDELTALTKRSGSNSWQVNGKGKVHILKGLKEQQLIAGDEISF